METKVLPIKDADALAEAVEILNAGGLVAFPTDTVYGVGALAFNETAVASIYEVKERGLEKAIPILIGDIDQLSHVASHVPPMAVKLAERFWPGPLTLIVPRHPSIPDVVTAMPTVGVRIPNLPAVRKLLRLTGPMAVTSANISGQSSPSTLVGVVAQLNGRIPLILDGGVTRGGTPSTLVDCTGAQPTLLRAGPISLEEIWQALA
jgi:L-threonylcarbamoyladenylate synthase